MAGFGIVFALGVSAQSFEAASVKPNPSPSLRHVILPPTGNRLSTRNASLRLLIQTAYGFNSSLVFGGPDWINTAGYDVEAEAAGNPTRAQIWLMLRSLLAERLNLKVHRETRQLPVYRLTISKRGLKLPKASEEDCSAVPAPCGNLTVMFEPATGLAIAGRQVTMSDLANQLTGALGRPVIDETGLSGKFDITLKFAYDQDITAGVPKPPSDPGTNPPLTSAITEQLGLSIESSKGPVEVLVIDHAEPASAN